MLYAVDAAPCPSCRFGCSMQLTTTVAQPHRCSSSAHSVQLMKHLRAWITMMGSRAHHQAVVVRCLRQGHASILQRGARAAGRHLLHLLHLSTTRSLHQQNRLETHSAVKEVSSKHPRLGKEWTCIMQAPLGAYSCGCVWISSTDQGVGSIVEALCGALD